MRSQTYSLDLALSDKYLDVTIRCLEPKAFKVKVEVLLGFFYFIE